VMPKTYRRYAGRDWRINAQMMRKLQIQVPPLLSCCQSDVRTTRQLKPWKCIHWLQ
jgi:hypothetical protein